MKRDWTQEGLSEALCALRFALIDLQLYLDMHPDCAEALHCFCDYRNQYDELAALYTRMFGPLTVQDVSGNNGWTWGMTPMPWEGGNCKCGNT